jgi:hypothetical protein
VDHPGNPLLPKTLIGYVRASERVGNCTIKVRSLANPLQSYKKTALISKLMDQKVFSVWGWLADRLYGLFDIDRESVVCELAATPLQAQDRAALIGELETRKDAEELIEYVKLVDFYTQETQLRDYVIRRDHTGYQMLEPELKQLSNYSIYVDRFVKHPNDLELVGWVRTAAPEEPAFPIRLPFKKLQTKQDISDTVWEAMEGESELELEASNLPFNWSTLVRRYDKAPRVAPVPRLGSIGDHVLYFPKFSLNTRTGKIDEGQSAAITPHNSHLHFSGIKPIAGSSLECYRELFSMQHPSAKGFAVALGHVVHGLVTRAARKDYAAKHLMFHTVLEEQPLWESTLEQLIQLFAGSDSYPHIWDLANLPKLRELYQATGCMPHFCNVNLRKDHLSSVIQRAPMMLIGLVPSEQAAAVVRHPNCCLVQQDVAAFDDEDPCKLPTDLLDSLRNNFPALLREVSLNTPISAESLADPIPATLGVRWICSILNMDPPEHLLDMVSDRKIFIQVNTPDAFLLCLSAAIGRGDVALSPSFSHSRRNCTIGYVQDNGDIVLWQQLAVAAANKYNGEQVFSAAHLMHDELKDGDKYKRHWVISRKWWETVCSRGSQVLTLNAAEVRRKAASDL